MPLIDVSDVLDDPDFATTFTVARKTQSIDNFGRASESGTTTTQTGVVYPASGRNLVRSAEGEMITGDIVVVTKYRLTEGNGATTQADVIGWGGTTYTVINTNDFSEYGAGFIKATCLKLSLN